MPDDALVDTDVGHDQLQACAEPGGVSMTEPVGVTFMVHRPLGQAPRGGSYAAAMTGSATHRDSVVVAVRASGSGDPQDGQGAALAAGAIGQRVALGRDDRL
jgi:hypothetical protein